MKYICTLTLVSLLPFALANTCETLLQGLKDTQETTKSVTRTLEMKQGNRKMASETWSITQDETGIEATLLERTGRQAPQNRGPGQGFSPNSSLLGLPVNVNCTGHELKQLSESHYELTLLTEDKETPIEQIRLSLKQQGERTLPLELTATAKMTMLLIPVNMNLNIRYQDWVFD